MKYVDRLHVLPTVTSGCATVVGLRGVSSHWPSLSVIWSQTCSTDDGHAVSDWKNILRILDAAARIALELKRVSRVLMVIPKLLLRL